MPVTDLVLTSFGTTMVHHGVSWPTKYPVVTVSSSHNLPVPRIPSLNYGSTDDGYVKVPIPGDITGYFVLMELNLQSEQCKPTVLR